MKKSCVAIIAAVSFALSHIAYAEQESRVAVVYTDADSFTDVTTRGLDGIRRHLRQRAESRLAQGQRLTVTITNVDMAGRFDPLRRPPVARVRIVTDIDPPRIDLRFTLANADGVVVREGERKLRDLGFMATTNLYPNDPLAYEKMLLDDWLERELPPVGSQLTVRKPDANPRAD